MSSLSRTERLRRMRARQDCYFIGDRTSKRYHAKDCPRIELIAEEIIVAEGGNRNRTYRLKA